MSISEESMTAEEVRDLFGFVHVNSVYRNAKKGIIPAHKVKGTHRWIFLRSEIMACIKNG
ncbi:MAG: helix-turn-helix domain-containing protein [Lachnospiraceae bacterium]|nr:helix-turn-helix domain-containing protein [Lachnospiraceae bacterium]